MFGAESVGQRVDLIFTGRNFPGLDKFLDLVGVVSRNIVQLVDIALGVEELPMVPFERRSRFVCRDHFPPVTVVGAIANALPILLGVKSCGIGIVECVRETGTLQWISFQPVSLVQRLQTDQVDNRRKDVDDVGELPAQDLTRGLDAIRPREDEGHGMATAHRRDLVEPERRIAGHRPTTRVVRPRRWPTNQFEVLEITRLVFTVASGGRA